MNRLSVTICLLASATLLLSGCATAEAGGGATPTVSATAEPSAPITPSAASAPPATPAAVVALAIGAATVTSMDAGGVALDNAAFADGADAMVAFISDAMGTEPVTSLTGTSDGDCAGPATLYAWGDGLLLSDPDMENPPLYTWKVEARAAQAGDGIRLESSTGFSIGDDGVAILAALPAEQFIDEYGDSTGPLLFEVAGADAEGTPYGGAALVGPDGLVSAITAPASLSAYYC
ncbi:MAG: hypothetical protein JWQ43_105 [Glaciihabitans sp.]|nr:hypothetical protein [Glaciihabitans sp.]